VPGRTGNRAPMTVPRNCYQASDGRWLAISGSALTVAERVMRLVGRPDLAEAAWFGQLEGRLAHQDEIDAAVAGWIAARKTDEVVAAFEAAEAAVAPVWSIADAVADPHLRARGSIAPVPHPLWGEVLMQGVVPRLASTPGRVRWTGAALGEHNQAILGDELGCSAEELAELAADGVIRGVEP
jgi:crotonobetainyl-CoA:carnitine CoA-transferase CaiB-like acyl-CoA transferase